MSKPTLSFLGRGKSAETAVPSWRADFRDVSSLPDLKVIRTDFLVNYGLVSFAVVALCYAGFVEFGHWSLSNEIDELSRDIQSRAALNVKNLADSGEFTAHMRYVDEFAGFKKPRVDCVDMLVALGGFKPGDLSVTGIVVDSASVDLKSKKERVRIQVAGTKVGFTPENVNMVGAAYKRFLALDLWSGNKDFNMLPPASPGIQNTEKSIDFTFELLLEAKK